MNCVMLGTVTMAIMTPLIQCSALSLMDSCRCCAWPWWAQCYHHSRAFLYCFSKPVCQIVCSWALYHSLIAQIFHWVILGINIMCCHWCSSISLGSQWNLDSFDSHNLWIIILNAFHHLTLCLVLLLLVPSSQGFLFTSSAVICECPSLFRWKNYCNPLFFYHLHHSSMLRGWFSYLSKIHVLR